MDATTVARVKALLDIPDATSTHDAVLGAIITAQSKRIENYIDRHLEDKARTEEYSIKPRQNVLFLRGYPASVITSIKIAVDWDYAAATALTASEYHLDTETGMIHLNYFPLTNYLGNNMATAPNVVQIMSTGGLAANAAGMISGYPDIAFACEQQVIAAWRRRDDPGRKSTKIGQYGTSVESPMTLLPDVVQTLMPYRRMRFGQ